MKRILINLINENQGAHLIQLKNFLKNLSNFDKKNIFYILSESDLIVKNNNFFLIKLNFSKNKYLLIFQRLLFQNFLINFYFWKYRINIYINFSHSVPFFIIKNIYKIIAVTNIAPFVKFKDYDFFLKLKLIFLKYKIIFNSKRSNSVISISKYCKKILEKNNIKSSKIKVLYNGIDYQKIDNKKNEFKYFLYVSHFYRYKNFEGLIDGFSNLPKEIKNQYKLLLVGYPYDIKYFNQINFKIKKLNLDKNIEIHSYLKREEIMSLIKNCDLYIFPSFIENCPMSLLEAIQFDKPILTSNIEPMNEFCK